MSWVKEVEMAKSIDDPMTSQSTEGKHFFDFEMLDAKTASALRKITFNSTFFQKGESVLKSNELKNMTDV